MRGRRGEGGGDYVEGLRKRGGCVERVGSWDEAGGKGGMGDVGRCREGGGRLEGTECKGDSKGRRRVRIVREMEIEGAGMDLVVRGNLKGGGAGW